MTAGGATPGRSVRHPADVRVRVVREQADLDPFAAALRGAARLAIDTETCMRTDGTIGPMRVLSAAARDASGAESAWVVDVRDLDARLLAPVLDGVLADAWNADFDARVTDTAVFAPVGAGRAAGIRWWDAQLADALLHSGKAGFGWYHGLAWATERYLGVHAEGKGTTQTSFGPDADLTDVQVAYAAADAVETLWVADELRHRLAEAGLERAAALEMGARPLLDHMERHGLPLDVDGFRRYLDEQVAARDGAVARLADLTGGGQANLFDDAVEPSWNPASETQAKDALNRFSPDEVRAWAARELGAARLLDDTDRLDHATLAAIGGPVAEGLLDYRNHAKLVGTYGENLLELLGPDDRFHPQYVQVVGANTGRLASRRPNAQNLAPQLGSHIRPRSTERVFVHADLSQAELRWLAQVSGDDAMRAAFAAGQDIHVATAERMFGVRLGAAPAEPSARAEWSSLRSRAKTINFGIVYGLGARALARGLTQADIATTVEEAQSLLASYLGAYPGVADWLERQDAIVDAVRADHEPVAWERTLELAAAHPAVQAARRGFRDDRERWPTAEEIAEHLRAEATGDGPSGLYRVSGGGADGGGAGGSGRGVDALVERIRWVQRYEDAVVLLDGDRPLSWTARTIAGRRRIFDVRADGVLGVAAVRAAASTKPEPTRQRAAFARAHQLTLAADGGGPLAEPRLQRIFEDRSLRRAWITHLRETMGPSAVDRLLDRALDDRLAAMVNAHRNAPIQGGVADAMLAAYGRLWGEIAADESIWPVQTVHDSLVVECDRADAHRVGAVLRSVMAGAFEDLCPDVPAVVDVDVRTTLSDDDVIAEL
ncbi:MAG: DNA polymerase [Actinomycetota bacterium]|nr:DNA polymerase [Actinomycetota bacterium]